MPTDSQDFLRRQCFAANSVAELGRRNPYAVVIKDFVSLFGPLGCYSSYRLQWLLTLQKLGVKHALKFSDAGLIMLLNVLDAPINQSIFSLPGN